MQLDNSSNGRNQQTFPLNTWWPKAKTSKGKCCFYPQDIIVSKTTCMHQISKSRSSTVCVSHARRTPPALNIPSVSHQTRLSSCIWISSAEKHWPQLNLQYFPQKKDAFALVLSSCNVKNGKPTSSLPYPTFLSLALIVSDGWCVQWWLERKNTQRKS